MVECGLKLMTLTWYPLVPHFQNKNLCLNCLAMMVCKLSLALYVRIESAVLSRKFSQASL